MNFAFLVSFLASISTLLGAAVLFIEYKDKNKPILMINEKIISNGKILTDREIRNYIKIFA